MARSEDALQRRALRRNRTLQEQQLADASKPRPPSKKHQEVESALAEPGAWKCPACENTNFASRYICNSKTCQEPKPESAIRATAEAKKERLLELQKPANNNSEKVPAGFSKLKTPKKRKAGNAEGPVSSKPEKKPKKRHDPETSKTIEWGSPQASANQIQYNQELRQRLGDKDPTLRGEELERAKILVARDERKKQKKMKSSISTKEEENKNEISRSTNSKTPNNPQECTKKDSPTSKSSAEQRKANKKLLQKYAQTHGDGLSEAEITRAKLLIARKQRKQEQQKLNRITRSSDADDNAKDTTDKELDNDNRALAGPEKEPSNKSVRKKEDKALRKRLKKTGGVGMSPDEISRANALIMAKQSKKEAKKRAVATQ